MNRIVQPELLDTLPVSDPRAIHSRRDLLRINAWMRNHVIMAEALQNAANRLAPQQITDLGAGDGRFLARVAKKLSAHWPHMNVTLLDNRPVAGSPALAAFPTLGWRAEVTVADVFDWLPTAKLDVVVTNLFLHHFNDERLAELFRVIAGRARLFVAIEPHRSFRPLFCCRWLWVIGCNSVTRHDATVSVRAGFSGRELSALWPAGGKWQLTERRTGLFSHLFVAKKIDLERADTSALFKAATCRRSPK